MGARRAAVGGESEELLGRWFARTGRRDEVFLATKGSGRVHDPDSLCTADGEADWDRGPAPGSSAPAPTRCAGRSTPACAGCGTDHVDLYYVHVDDRATPLEETLEALAGIVAAGKARYIGWSNVRTWRLERIRQLCAAATAGRRRSRCSSSTATCAAGPGWSTAPSWTTSSWTTCASTTT